MEEFDLLSWSGWEKFPVYLLAGFYFVFGLIIAFVPPHYRAAITVDTAIASFGLWPLAFVNCAVGIYAAIENWKFSSFRGLYLINILSIFWFLITFLPLTKPVGPNGPEGPAIYNAFATLTWLLIICFAAFRYITLSRIARQKYLHDELKEDRELLAQPLYLTKEETQSPSLTKDTSDS